MLCSVSVCFAHALPGFVSVFPWYVQALPDVSQSVSGLKWFLHVFLIQNQLRPILIFAFKYILFMAAKPSFVQQDLYVEIHENIDRFKRLSLPDKNNFGQFCNCFSVLFVLTALFETLVTGKLRLLVLIER